MSNVLVAYASKHGATEEIAEAVADLRPPPGGRAPGWRAGLYAARPAR